MIYAVLFEDDEAHADMRQRHMAEHLAFLERNAASVLAAGPLREAPGGAAAGGMWLVSCADEPAVRALVAADPFWPTGLRRSVTVLEWHQVFAQGCRVART